MSAVRLLFDENLSPKLVKRLAQSYPDSRHVRDLGLLGAPDADIWARAAAESFVLVTKDDDFRQLSFLRGAPPKVLWLVVGNAPSKDIAHLLGTEARLVEQFVADPDAAILVLRLRAGD